jgi:hypothetical protein
MYPLRSKTVTRRISSDPEKGAFGDELEVTMAEAKFFAF